MEYDKDQVDEMTMALIFLVTTREGEGGRAWKGFDWKILERLHQRGWLAQPQIKSLSLEITAEGMAKGQECFEKYCRRAGMAGAPSPPDHEKGNP